MLQFLHFVIKNTSCFSLAIFGHHVGSSCVGHDFYSTKNVVVWYLKNVWFVWIKNRVWWSFGMEELYQGICEFNRTSNQRPPLEAAS